MKINILGSSWTVEKRTVEQEPRLSDCNGFTDWTSRLIVVVSGMESDLDSPATFQRKILRHEIVHAFIWESGLTNNSFCPENWAENEEMVDWIALQGPKIYRAWQEADCL